MLTIPLSLILFASHAASWQFNFNSTAVVNTSATVTWTRNDDDSTTTGFGFRLRQPDVLPSTETVPYWCIFGGVGETKGAFFVEFFTAGSYIAEAMQIAANQTTNSSRDILGSSDIISVQPTDSQTPQDMLTLNFVVNTAVQETNTETTSATPSAPSTIFSSPTARSIVPIPSDTPEPSSSPLASTSNRTAIIAGSVCGSLGLVAIMTGISICLYRRRDAASNEAFPDQQPYYTTTAQPYTITTTPTSTMMPSKISASEVPRDAALTVRQAMLRDRAEGLQAQVAILRQNKTEGRLMEENERQRQQIASLERQMTYLMEQQRSAWALGYTNEPPPSYMSGSSNGIS